MKTLILIVSFFAVLHPGLSQIPEVAWEKQIPVSSSHYFTDAIEIQDGNFVVLGAIEKPETGIFNIWLLKIDKKGDTLKSRVIENPANVIPARIVQNGNKDFAIAFMTTNADKKKLSGLLSFDEEFSVKWQIYSEKPSVITRTDLAADTEGNYWWLNTFSDADEKPQISLWKLDSEGNKTLEFNFLDGVSAWGYSLRLLLDGTLGIALQVQPDKGNPAVQVMKVNTKGEVLWQTLIPQAEKALTPQCLCCSPDNSLVVGGWAGLCYNPDAPPEEQIWDYDYWLTKLDSNGKVLWTQNYNREGSEKGTAVAVLPDGKIMAAGKCETSFTGTIGPWLLFVDPNGKKLEDQVYKFRFIQDQVARIICTSDRGFLMVGPGYIETHHRLSGWIRKLNPVL